MIVTQWFYGYKTPKHIGVYERSHPLIPGLMPYSYWDGKQWGFSSNTPYAANADKEIKSKYQDVRWRGIAK